MSTAPPGNDRPDPDRRGTGSPPVPVTDKRRMALAGVCLAVPVVALMWVPSYAKDGPELFSFPFFFWYQFLWVFLCSGFTWTAYKLTLSARRGSPRTPTGGER